MCHNGSTHLIDAVELLLQGWLMRHLTGLLHVTCCCVLLLPCRCRAARFCGRPCLEAAWKGHKAACKALQQQQEAR
jgi:hypothetical protein